MRILESHAVWAGALSAVLPAAAALAQTAASYPSRAITLVVPYTPGSGIDILARVIAPELNRKWGEPVVVDNKPGASGIVGADAVAKAAPNGYTLMVTVNSFTMAPPLYRNMPYDPIADFTPIAKIALARYAFAVNPAVLAVSDFPEFVAAVKAKPGALNYGSPGNGTAFHLAMELMKQHLGLQITHVPYKGLSGAMTDLLGGRVQMMFATVHALLPSQKAGKLKFLAMTGPGRSPFAPDVPTFRERGFDFMDDIDGWYAVMGPAKLPRDIVAKLNAELRAIMFSADVREQLTAQGLLPVASTPEELAALIKADLPRWAKVVAEAKIGAD
jgi:tripartite-type tricarboxylate transporter receptor subunit TctC